MLFAEELMDHPRFLTLRYEDLAKDPDSVQSKISSFLPFLKEKINSANTTANPSSDSQLALGDIRPINDKSVGNWRNHKARILGQIMENGSISDDLIKYGYEPDKSWEKELEGVEPDLKESHASDFYKPWFIRKKQRGKYLRAIRVWFYHTPFFLWFLDKWVGKKK